MEAPIGSIIAFAGEIDPGFAAKTGWMLCDGRLLDANDPTYKPLFDAIQYAWGGDQKREFFNVPNLAGYFLRGVEQRGGGKDPNGDERFTNNPGGNAGRNVGSFQEPATGMPKNPFKTGVPNDPNDPNAMQGEHQHDMDFEINASRDVDGQDNTVAFPWIEGSPRTRTGVGGRHGHAIIGGDMETRPHNAYVHWIIRFR
jgi:hypothetical protein